MAVEGFRFDIGPQIATDLDTGSAREWLVTDALGGYAMGTVSGLRTRRYHGLLVLATDPPRARRLALASLDPVLRIGDRRVRLATHEWRSGAVDPDGHRYRSAFALIDGVPRWRWQVGPVVIEAEVAMAHGQAAVGVVHRCVATDRPVELELEVMCAWRDVHGETDSTLDPPLMHDAGGFSWPAAYRVSGPGWEPGGTWYRGVHHREEAARGLPADDDLWFAGRFRSTLDVGATIEVAAWSIVGKGATSEPERAAQLVATARTRARSIASTAGSTDSVDAALVHAADQHIAAGSVVAGYPWFGDWSRDTLVSYRGLFLETGRADEGRDVLMRLAGSLRDGLLANTADTGTRKDNSADAPLWLVHAVRSHIETTGDFDLAVELLPALDSIAEAYSNGTGYGIGPTGTGLVRAEAPGEALTWMDARVAGVPVTPRVGTPVEIAALWTSALGSLTWLHERTRGDPTPFVRRRADAVRAFGRFARGDGAGLADVLAPDDDARRPNQLLATALVDGPLFADAESARAVVDACAALLTPLGLRSLAPDDPRYLGRHRGGPDERDRAYHQGTVWPWLIGAYVDSALVLDPRASAPHAAAARATVEALARHLGDAGVGSVSETADGDAPHHPTGCPFQAWSAAELLRARRRLDG